jgi:hypothetical protein
MLRCQFDSGWYYSMHSALVKEEKSSSNSEITFSGAGVESSTSKEKGLWATGNTELNMGPGTCPAGED